MAVSEKKGPTVHDIFKAVKDTSADRHDFLVFLHLEPRKIREFKRSSPAIDNWAFVQALEYFLQNCEEGKEWLTIVDALKECGDFKTSEVIKREHIVQDEEATPVKLKSQLPNKPHPNLQLDGDASFDYYCVFNNMTEGVQSPPGYAQVPHPTLTSEDKKLEYLEKLKRMTTVEHNTAARNVDLFHHEVQEALNNEQLDNKKTLTDYKRKMDRQKDANEKDVEELLEKTTELQKSLQEAVSKLKIGDSTAFSTIEKVDDEFVEIEKQLRRLEKNIDKYQRHIHHFQSSSSTSTSDRVLQDLQANITININVSGTIDDEDYVLVNEGLTYHHIGNI